MKPTTLENQITDQLFKITEQDEQYINYIIDCISGLDNCIEPER